MNVPRDTVATIKRSFKDSLLTESQLIGILRLCLGKPRWENCLGFGWNSCGKKSFYQRVIYSMRVDAGTILIFKLISFRSLELNICGLTDWQTDLLTERETWPLIEMRGLISSKRWRRVTGPDTRLPQSLRGSDGESHSGILAGVVS